MTRSRNALLSALELITVVVLIAGCTSAATSIQTQSTPPSSAAFPTTPAAPTSVPLTTPPSTAHLSAVAADAPNAASPPAFELLQSIPVKGRAPMTGYSRDQFGQAWSDDNDDPLGHNGCDSRNDILRRDLTSRVLKPGTAGCVVASGSLLDPYTGRRLAFVRGEATSAAVQIDHVVALGDAWQTGAQQLSSEARVDLANDPLELLAVDGPSNAAKGDGDAATWLPPNKAYRCAYVARQIAVKARWHLWMTNSEYAASARVLATCPKQPAPAEPRLTISLRPTVSRAPPTRSPAPRSTHSAAPTSTPPQSCTQTSSGSCIRGGEFCPQDSYGQIGTDAEGRRYLCTGDRDRPHWELP